MPPRPRHDIRSASKKAKREAEKAHENFVDAIERGDIEDIFTYQNTVCDAIDTYNAANLLRHMYYREYVWNANAESRNHSVPPPIRNLRLHIPEGAEMFNFDWTGSVPLPIKTEYEMMELHLFGGSWKMLDMDGVRELLESFGSEDLASHVELNIDIKEYDPGYTTFDVYAKDEGMNEHKRREFIYKTENTNHRRVKIDTSRNEVFEIPHRYEDSS